MNQRARYPLNVAGDFYVENGLCIACTAPEEQAPDLMSHDSSASGGYHCYFKKQPETPEELERAVMALAVGCCRSVRYGGTDPRVIQRLSECNSADVCDALSDAPTVSNVPSFPVRILRGLKRLFFP